MLRSEAIDATVVETLAGELVDKLGATRAAIKLLQGEARALEDWIIHLRAPEGVIPGSSYIASGEDYSIRITSALPNQRRSTDTTRPRVTLVPEPSGGLDYLMREHPPT